ncbi:MAG TPA: hypothetical protein IAB17_02420 [Candidatus Alectryocaccobium stercorigallinarum]|nr:hypothetical protein [Candidatus Alectryocaccobium stercorigallinarum]
MKSSPRNKKAAGKNRKIIYSTYKYSAAELIKYGAVGAAAGLIICWLCYHSVYSIPLAFAVMLIYLKTKKTSLIEKRKKQLLFHFKDFLGALHSSLNSGYSVENGIAEALEDIRQLYGDKDVMTVEIKFMLQGLKIGRPVEELFYDLGERSTLSDIRLFAELLSIGKKQGGRLGKILGDTRYIICGKIDTEQEIDRQLSAKKYEQKIMCFMPACVILYMRLTFSGFIEQLYGNTPGVIIMSICLAVYAGAYYMGKKIVSIKV